MSEVIRPSIPYYGVIPGGLHDGKRIIIKGNVPYAANIFQVNLMTDHYVSLRCDRPLHVSVWFNEDVVVRNALLDESYGDEETSGPFPFRFGSKFILEISVNVESYRISVNGCHSWEFSHRTSFRRVSSIYIDDDIQIDRIEYLNRVQSSIDMDDDVQIDSIEYLNRAQSPIDSDDDVQIDSIEYLNRAQSSIDSDEDVQIDRIEYLDRNRVQRAPEASRRTPLFTSAPEASIRTSLLTSAPQASTRTSLFTSAPEASARTSLLTSAPQLSTGTSLFTSAPEASTGSTSLTSVRGALTRPLFTSVPEASTVTSFFTSVPEASTGTSFFTSVPQASTSTTFFTSPWIFPIHGGLKEGMQILIKGSPVSSPQNFTISLQKGSRVFFERDIAFYMEVRFSSRSIVRNSRSNFVWGEEQTMISHFPFLPGVTFSMVITVQSDRYTVDINGGHILSFSHRLNDLSQFNVICIYKDVIITAIEYKFYEL